jgi:DNA polymerase-3 subunit gamma/tau
MEKICKKEDVEINPKSLGLIAREANGSMRDGLSLLDQVMSCIQGTISHDQVLDILGIVDREIIFKISGAALREDIAEILDILDEVYSAGHDMKKLYADLIEHFRNLLIVKMGEKNRKLVDIPTHEIDLILDQVKNVPTIFLNQIFDLLFKEEVTLEHSSHPKLAIETVFFRIFQAKPALPIDVLIAKLDNFRKDIYETKTDVAVIETSSTFQDERKDSQSTLNRTTGTAESLETFASAPETPVDQDEDIKGTWKRLLSIISEKHPSLVANLKNSMIKTLANNRIEIEVNGSHFNVNMILRDKNKAIIKKICGDFFGKEMDVVIVPKKIKEPEHQEKKSQAGRLKQKALSHPLVTDALEIFNGNVVDVKIL